MTDERYWQTKLHARLHDPAEKALVLLRDPAGHEGGTSRALHRDLGFHELPPQGSLEHDHSEVLDGVVFKQGIPVDIYKEVRRADHWAAAADRPQWPMEEITVTTRDGQQRTFKVADWAQVRWTRNPVLIHPLTGSEISLNSLDDTEIGDIKRRSLDHFTQLKQMSGDGVDWRKTLCAFWRFGPELVEAHGDRKLGLLWPLLPADTRVPDHSIWDHLDLTSAFAGAFAADSEQQAALLALAIGPVQDFISAARSTSDLWAGSHLLSRLSWEAIKVVCERLGPDAILFPRLRAVPQVDVWLRDEVGLPGDWFDRCSWTRRATDANPLFAAALPNRFVAIVPQSQAQEIAEIVTHRVRTWLAQTGESVVDRLLEAAGFRNPGDTRDLSVHAYGQMRRQTQGFPEVHWASVPFSLIQSSPDGLDTRQLAAAMAPFFGASSNEAVGFLKSPAWEVLQKGAKLRQSVFFTPNPGVLYPAVYDLLERVLAAAKSVRKFDQNEERGWRCSLSGETEWLTCDPGQLEVSYRSQDDTLWMRIADREPGWVKRGEHLGALGAIKRLWPTLFSEEVGAVLGEAKVDRFVVSTHTLALADNLAELDRRLCDGEAAAAFEGLVLKQDRAPALPRSLASLRDSLAARVPAALDRLRSSDDPEDAARLRRLEKLVGNHLGFKPETYYSLVLMDGDNMGSILSGDSRYSITYERAFHPQVRSGFRERLAAEPLIAAYGRQQRAMSPNRHLAVSSALNDFALHLVPEVLESEFRGRVIYSGGDDVLAMLPVSDLLPAAQRLRSVYSGVSPAEVEIDWRRIRGSEGLACKGGFAHLRGRLMRMMGESATASCGAVIAHHLAPLGAVLRELREAEGRAKAAPGKDSFSLTVIKRSGGALHLTAKWGEPLALLRSFQLFLADRQVSRRAVYHSLQWLKDLPREADPEMLGSLVGYQLARQTSSPEARRRHDVTGLAQRLVKCSTVGPSVCTLWLSNFLSVAEFLARECRLRPEPAEASELQLSGPNRA